MDAPRERHARIKRLFHEARDLPPGERAAYLDRACDDAAMRREVESLLRHDAEEEASTLAAPRPRPVPKQVGPYRVLEILGEGGFGIVYRAEQTEPVRRIVALKVIKPGMDTHDVLGRFETERQALALMDHPNVATVLDAGEDESGRPFFVMQHVAGVPITEYCDTRRLSLEERMGLFLQVCEAIQHAHQKGIIHRDIKPGNVLVTDRAGRPAPVVIDFGIARAIDRRLTERTIFTAQGQMIGTPEYMSPEQAAMTGSDIDIRTDIYSLGVLLYELLAGALPFEPTELRQRAHAKVLEIIRTEDPPRPSTRLSGLTDAECGAIARHRRTSRAAMVRELRGDVDWITMKAMEKDRNRRYASATELAADVRRHLHDEPVLAGPPSVGYRVGKFVRRHRVGVAVTTVVALSLVAGIIGTSWGRFEAIEARDEAQAAERDARHARDLAKQSEAAARRSAYRATIAAAAAAVAGEDLAAARLYLDEAPREHRGWEWDHLTAVSDDAVLVRRDHAGPVVCLAATPDGALVATGSMAGDLLVHDAATGEPVLTLPRQPGPILAVAISRDGTTLAAGGEDAQVRLFGLPDGRPLGQRGFPGERIRAIAFTADGDEVLVGSGAEVTAWTVVTNEMRSLGRALGNVTDVAVSPDGTRVAITRISPTANSLIVCGPDGEEMASATDLSHPTKTVAFSPDGSLVLTGEGDGDVVVRDAATGRERSRLSGHALEVFDIRFDRKGERLVTASRDRTVRVWDFEQHAMLRRFRGHTDTVNGALFRDAGSLLSAASDSTLRAWRLEPIATRLIRFEHHGPAAHVAWAPDGSWLVSAGADQTVRRWDPVTGRPVGASWRHEPSLSALAVAPDGGRIAFGDINGFVTVRNIAGRAPDGRYIMHRSEAVTAVVFNADGSLLATGSDQGTVTVLDTASGEVVVSWLAHASTDEEVSFVPVEAVAFAPDGQLVTGGSKSVVVWDPRTAATIGRWTARTSISAVAVSSDGERIAVGDYRGGLELLDRSTLESIGTLADHTEMITAVCFSPDGTRLASSSADWTARLWDPARSRSLLALRGHGDFLQDLAFSPDGRTLATASIDHTVRLWSAVAPGAVESPGDD
ncbi:MAG: WD40 repeat domain-containing serine/threonine protein kinase [Planctomycetota bacterium]|jgi:WD40 repeat protein/serine/threonine protein kinase